MIGMDRVAVEEEKEKTPPVALGFSGTLRAVVLGSGACHLSLFAYLRFLASWMGGRDERNERENSQIKARSSGKSV